MAYVDAASGKCAGRGDEAVEMKITWSISPIRAAVALPGSRFRRAVRSSLANYISRVIFRGYGMYVHSCPYVVLG